MEAFGHMVFALGMPGPLELSIILIIALLLFGKRLPDVMRSMGKGVVEFKRGLKDVNRDIEDEADKPIDAPPPPPPPPSVDDKA